MEVVELPKKYSVILLNNEKVVILDLETRDVCKISLNPLRVEENALKNRRIAQKIVRVLSTFQAYKTPAITCYL